MPVSTIYGPILQERLFEVSDAAGATHRAQFRQRQERSVTQRPVGSLQLVAVFKPSSATVASTAYAYDTVGRVKEARDAIAVASPSARGAHKFFIAEGYRGEREDPVGGRYAVEALEGGRLTRHIDEMGRMSTAVSDGRGRVLKRTSAWGDITEFEYDARDNTTLLRRRSRDGCGTDAYWCQTSVVTATYHATWNKPLTVTLPATGPDAQAASTWTFAYDGQGRVTTQTSPVVANGLGGTGQAVWHTLYDSFGRVRWTKDPTGIEARMVYGASNLGRCLTEQHAADQSSTFRQTSLFTCNAAGDVLTATDPRGNVTTFTYDALRRRTSEVGPVSTGIQTQWVFDSDGNLTQERRWDSSASLWRTMTTAYSLTGQPLMVTDPSGDVSRACYDGLDRATVAVDPTGRATRTTYNLAGQPTLIERWFSANLADATCNLTNIRPPHLTTNRWRGMEYNAGGLQSAEIDGNGNRTTLDYDGLGRPMRTTFADGKFIQTVRNERDQVVITVKRSGDVHQAFYDPIGRIDRVWEHSPGAGYPIGRVVRTSYDLASRPTWTDVSTQTTPTWDNALLRDIRTYGYDPAGRVQFDRVTPNNGTMGSTQQVLTYGYDKANNRTSIQWPDAYTATYRFDAANRADRVTFGTHQADIAVDSLSRRTSLSRSNGVTTTYAYEGDSDLAQINHAWAPSTGQTAAIFGLQRDAAGRITGQSINRPDLEWAPGLDYAQTYGAPTNLNQTTSRNGTALVWDDNGNLDSYGTTDYQWTWGNRLMRVVKPGSTTEYAYDSIDRRTVVIQDGVMTRTLWSGSDEVGEYDLAGVLKRRYIPDGSGAMDARLATVNPDNTIHWHHTDHQGSVIATSNAAGQGTGFTNYSPHGEFGTAANGAALSVPPIGSPFGYTGRQYDPETELYQYRARYYSPELGVFLSMDPIGTKDDPNLYLYAANDPVNHTDPTGMYRRGAGFTDSEWRRFDQAQQRQASSMERRADRLVRQADRMDRRNPGSGDTKRLAAGNLRAGAANLRDNSDSGPVANLYTEQDYAQLGRPPGSQAHTIHGGWETNFSRGSLGVFGRDGLGAGWVIGHEALHLRGPALSDQRGPNGALAYKGGESVNTDALKAIRLTPLAAINPDSLLNGDN
jgi:RHS repeat-associated protein